MTGKRSPRAAALFAATTLFVVAAPRASHADAEGEHAAQQSFDRGMKAREEGKCQTIPVGNPAKCRESIDAFRRAYALNPSALGALRNLAYVERSMGLVTSAARHFRELARKAPLDPKPERQRWAQFAEDEAKALEPRAPHLTVKVPRDRPADLKVFLDEEPLAEPLWGTAIDVDPGVHAVRAASEKVPTFAVSFELGEREGRSIEVVFPVPTIAPAAPADSVAAPPRVAAEPPPPSSPPVAVKPQPERITKTHIAPIVVSGAGLLVFGGGLVAGVAARNNRDSSCDASTKLCEAGGLSTARTLAVTSTILTITGAVTVVGGLVWLITSPTTSSIGSADKAHAPSLSPYLSLRGGGVYGTF